MPPLRRQRPRRCPSPEKYDKQSRTASRWPPGPSCWAVPAGLLRQWRVRSRSTTQQARQTVCGFSAAVCSRGARRLQRWKCRPHNGNTHLRIGNVAPARGFWSKMSSRSALFIADVGFPRARGKMDGKWAQTAATAIDGFQAHLRPKSGQIAAAKRLPNGCQTAAEWRGSWASVLSMFVRQMVRNIVGKRQ